ncbi:exodeoxyribonuclease V subunit alpha [Sphaerotilus sp.]|uniref:exodeoxyribonuclease V subunit alpha n=1 Tax=Sphaerotilus sp. TaxID=2093942 RepID=UPI002ACEE5BF|nr:exodeoxyribonuclease V subunit alpha [Sphaerotilus sp.]MDZ7858046.1 exodeoxyribonuclease V subunit alpha [Sphaerotilus sp.]
MPPLLPPDPIPDDPAPLGPLTPTALLAELDRWCDAGWLRRLDVALARWLKDELDAEPTPAAPELLLCAALLAQRESRGHTCITLEALLHQRRAEAIARPDDDAWLDGPAAARAALAGALARLSPDLADWHHHLRSSAAVDDGTAAGQGASPFVLDAAPDGTRLYLRRHWRDEQSVARAVLARTHAAAALGHASADTAGATGHPPEPLPAPATVRHWLDRLFGPTEPGAAPGDPGAPAAPDWQRIACAMALRGRIALITGGPGTGKTYTVARLLALLFALHPAPDTLRIALAAPTGKAAARLKQSIDQALGQLGAALPGVLDWALLANRLKEALTLHRLLGARPDTRALRHDARHPLDVDLLVVDEASMVHLEMMAALLAALPERARLVLLGDKDQLASVEAGAVLGDLCGPAEHGHYDADSVAWIAACTGSTLPPALQHQAHQPLPALAQQTVMLRESRRFQGAIGALAQAVNAGDVRAAEAVFRHREPAVQRLVLTEAQALPAVLELALRGRPGAPVGYGLYLSELAQKPPAGDVAAHEAWVVRVLRAFERVRLLCALREGDWGVTGLNARIEAHLRGRGVVARHGEWYAGRPVMITRNDAALGVYNGDVGVALPGVDGGASLRVWRLEGESQPPRSVMASRLAATETAFAMTVHKSQGSEFEHVALVLPPHLNPVLTRELVYTGITRAKAAFTLVAPDPAVWAQALQRRTRRASGLPGLLTSGLR